jgi:hypothetical protein
MNGDVNSKQSGEASPGNGSVFDYANMQVEFNR